jgi:hypothetical protein
MSSENLVFETMELHLSPPASVQPMPADHIPFNDQSFSAQYQAILENGPRAYFDYLCGMIDPDDFDLSKYKIDEVLSWTNLDDNEDTFDTWLEARDPSNDDDARIIRTALKFGICCGMPTLWYLVCKLPADELVSWTYHLREHDWSHDHDIPHIHGMPMIPAAHATILREILAVDAKDQPRYSAVIRHMDWAAANARLEEVD